ncbi:uncharacterized protein KY384_009063 [Bacidia gigantensis]|uniref:uncharacterized protein n=1 Tax=Bacidia gigantensis TaxID=2732470 RepID=UPI001D03E93F|nr:uncharacterized protein KY384_009063 [Bacidia gigantensis]KAG8525419.1 hypothetical protein KY384_009063 [Bacidia gigantensis]
MDPMARPSPYATRSGPSQPLESPQGDLIDVPEATSEFLDPSNVVERLGKISSSSDTYYAFQLNAEWIRIYDPNTTFVKVECTCDGFRRAQSPCDHLQWLLRGLKASLQNEWFSVSQATMHLLSTELSQLYPAFDAFEPADLIQKINALRDPGSVTAGIGYLGTPGNTYRSKVLCDIISTFDARTEVLPEAYQADFEGQLPIPSRLEECLQRDSLTGTIYRMAFVEPSIFDALQKTVPRQYCADVYLGKQQINIRNHLEQMDKDVEQAHIEGQVLRNHIIPRCGKSLRQIVEQLYEYRAHQEAITPSHGKRLASMLVGLIQQVYNRNRDHRTGTKARAARNEFNLFEFLIRSPDQLGPGDECFAIGKLERLPVTERKHLREPLAVIRDDFQQMPQTSALSTYVNKIEDIIRREDAAI